MTVEVLHRFTLNIAFIGVTGLAETGFTVADVNDAQVKMVAIERGRKVWSSLWTIPRWAPSIS